MQGFSGFPMKGRLIRLPALFFSELLPAIDSLAELKVTLYCMWQMQERDDDVIYLRRRDFLVDQRFMNGLGPRDEARLQALDDGLERAAARGTLIEVVAQLGDARESLYFINTERGRALVKGLADGTWTPDMRPMKPLEVQVERPSLYTLYEQNIGPLTPLIADALTDLENTYPLAWIEDAIQIAVKANVRKLPYIEAILKRWESEGRIDTGSSAPPGEGWERFLGKYGDDFEN